MAHKLSHTSKFKITYILVLTNMGQHPYIYSHACIPTHFFSSTTYARAHIHTHKHTLHIHTLTHTHTLMYAQTHARTLVSSHALAYTCANTYKYKQYTNAITYTHYAHIHTGLHTGSHIQTHTHKHALPVT